MEVNVRRTIFGKSTYQNVIDTKFNQLVPKSPLIQETPIVSIDDFFNSYDELFYNIPTSGSNKSHLELVNKSSDYLGISFEDLNSEIQELRNENVALKSQLYTLTNQLNTQITQ